MDPMLNTVATVEVWQNFFPTACLCYRAALSHRKFCDDEMSCVCCTEDYGSHYAHIALSAWNLPTVTLELNCELYFLTICSNNTGPRDYHTKWSQKDKDK